MRQAAALRSVLVKFEGLSLRGVHTQAHNGNPGNFNAMSATTLGSSLLKHEHSLSNTIIKQFTKSKKSVTLDQPKVVQLHLLSNCQILNCLTGIQNEKIDKVNENLSYECPKIGNLIEMETPTAIRNIVPIETPTLHQKVIESPGTTIEKLAHKELRRRHRSMKKHQRDRLKQKMWPEIRKVKFMRRLKKKKLLKKYADRYKSKAESFDAWEHMKAQLDLARKKGYHVNIYKENTEPWYQKA